jgi:CelD/BcsL family acetyltransferase involved in cellulose biosynthesis
MSPVSPTLIRLSLEDPRWREFVACAANASPFHDPSWAALLGDTYGYDTFALAVADASGGLAAGAPFLEVRTVTRRRRWVSLPFTDECGLLATDDGAPAILVQAIADAQRTGLTPGVEVRGSVDGFGWRTGGDAVTHKLELDSDLQRVRAGFSRSQVIRNIARAEREGVTVRRAGEPRDLDAFYRLHTRTRRRQGVPVQPRRFFDLIWSRLVAPGTAHVLLAESDGQAVAGALFLTDARTTIYKFGASEVEKLRLRPNHLIFWTAVQDACRAGHRVFDFGRTDLNNAGLRAFKRSWGATERPLRYSTLERGGAAATDGVASRVLSFAIRRGPAWMCRGAGEALYRYAASR